VLKAFVKVRIKNEFDYAKGFIHQPTCIWRDPALKKALCLDFDGGATGIAS
jgi:hypothetical protein